MLVAMSCSRDQEVVMKHVENGEYILLLKVDLNFNEVLSFGDHTHDTSKH